MKTGNGIGRFDHNFLRSVYLATPQGQRPNFEDIAQKAGCEPGEAKSAHGAMVDAGWYRRDDVERLRGFLHRQIPFEPAALMERITRDRTVAPSSPLLAKFSTGPIEKPKLWHGTSAAFEQDAVEPGHGQSGLQNTYATPDLDLARVYALRNEHMFKVSSIGARNRERELYVLIDDRDAFLSKVEQTGGGRVFQLDNSTFKPHNNSTMEWVSSAPADIIADATEQITGLDDLKNSPNTHVFFGSPGMAADWDTIERMDAAFAGGPDAARQLFAKLVEESLLVQWSTATEA